jgi:outer membrane protein assembly factor BamB/predicted Ser/Thr protein kinase
MRELGPSSRRGTGELLKPGANLTDRYLIKAQVGIGGMSAVYKARDLHFPNVEKIVALKEMFNQGRDLAARQAIVHNFEREADLLATLSHPAIPRIFDYFTQDDRSYLVLEFIEGKNLENIINETEAFLSEQQVVTWAIELCDVLDYLHNHKPKPIIFRDMKPSNVMINLRNQVVLIDFGIAKHFQVGQKGTMIGTEGYAPPEQYRGDATHLADIYALGATLHHMLTRLDPRQEPPFYFGDFPIRKANPNISMELETVIDIALQYNSEDRFQNVDAMREALISAARKTGLLAALPLTTGMVSKAGDITPLWSFDCEDEIRGSPTTADGIVYVGSYDHNLYAINAETGEFGWKYPTDKGIVSRPAVYDKHVIFGSEDHAVYVLSARAGQLQWTYYTDGPIRSSPFIAEGHIFIGSDDGYLHAINVTNERRAWRIDTGSAVRSTPYVGNDPEAIFIGNEYGDFFCLDFRGETRWRFKAKRAITASPLLAEGVVYFGSVDSYIYALESKTGWMIWRYRLGKATISTPVIAERLIFTGSADGNIYCLDARSAREIWRFTTENQVTGSPLIHNDSLYCGSVDGYLYCLEYRTGILRWKFKTGGPITGAPVISNDTIYFGSLDHRLYALPVV